MSKKAAKVQQKDQTYETRDIVLAKVRGYPPWPGIIVDPDSVSEDVQKERPNSKAKKGNWYCVRFFPAGDHAWIVPKDISRLQRHEIEAYIDEPYKRSSELLQGYKIALDPKKWEEEREAARAEAAEAEANAEVDQLDSDGGVEEEEEEEKKSKSKKRRRDSDVAPAKSKAQSKPKKEPSEAKKKTNSTAKGKRNGIKSKTLVESEDDGDADGGDGEDAGPGKKASPPPTKKQKRDKEEDEADSALNNDPEATKVRDWRHKLQKAFLGKATPKEEDMPSLDAVFTTVETYDNMTIQYLTFSKIGKVMRHIYNLPEDKVPRDSEFKFKERAKALVDKWHDILNASKTNGDIGMRRAAANGKAHSEEAGAKSADGKEASPSETAKAQGDVTEVDAKEAQPQETKEALKDELETKESEPSTAPDADAPAEAEDAPADNTVDELATKDVVMADAA